MNENEKDSRLNEKYIDLRKKIDSGDYIPTDLVRLGNICVQLEQREEAILYYQKSVKADPQLSRLLKPKLQKLFSSDELKDFIFPAPDFPWNTDMHFAFSYPLSGDGKAVILFGGIIFGLLISFFGTYARLGYFLWIPFLVIYFQNILYLSSLGKKDAPTWPDVYDIFSAGLVPFFQIILPFAFFYSIYELNHAFFSNNMLLLYIYVFISLSYVGAAILLICLYNSLLFFFNIIMIIKFIWTRTGEYFLSIAAIYSIFFYHIQVSPFILLKKSLIFALLYPSIYCMATIYFIQVAGYLLGSFYHRNRKEYAAFTGFKTATFERDHLVKKGFATSLEDYKKKIIPLPVIITVFLGWVLLNWIFSVIAKF